MNFKNELKFNMYIWKTDSISNYIKSTSITDLHKNETLPRALTNNNHHATIHLSFAKSLFLFLFFFLVNILILSKNSGILGVKKLEKNERCRRLQHDSGAIPSYTLGLSLFLKNILESLPFYYSYIPLVITVI